MIVLLASECSVLSMALLLTLIHGVDSSAGLKAQVMEFSESAPEK